MMRLYRLLLRLYPSSYRAEYGDELANLFAARHRGTGWIIAMLAAIADIVPNAIAVHWDILRHSRRRETRRSNHLRLGNRDLRSGIGHRMSAAGGTCGQRRPGDCVTR